MWAMPRVASSIPAAPSVRGRAQCRGARMTYVGPDNRYYYCTGSLLNNTASGTTPYFLSASHCISTQATAAAHGLVFRSASCNSFEAECKHLALQRGATLLYSTAVTDATLMRLNEVPPAGATLAGWDARGTAVTGTDHLRTASPAGRLAQIQRRPSAELQNCNLGAGGSITCSPAMPRAIL